MALVFVTAAMAEEAPSRLNHPVPDGWTLSVDGKTLLPPGGNAAVIFAPSAPFTGTAEQWIAESWEGIARELKLLSGPAPGTQGAFLSRMGLFQHADGRQVWVCLNTLVRDGRGESVMLVAGGEENFRAHLPALSRLLARTTVASSGAPSSASTSASTGVSTGESTASTVKPPETGRSPGVSASARDNTVPGLYLASTAQYRLNPLGGSGSGSMEWRTEFYLLSRDGRVFRGPDLPNAPDGDIRRFDYDAARREVPAASGTWTASGRDVVLKLGERAQEVIVATRPAPGVLEIRGTKFKQSVATP
jgi:hypothetical protein